MVGSIVNRLNAHSRELGANVLHRRARHRSEDKGWTHRQKVGNGNFALRPLLKLARPPIEAVVWSPVEEERAEGQCTVALNLAGDQHVEHCIVHAGYLADELDHTLTVVTRRLVPLFPMLAIESIRSAHRLIRVPSCSRSSSIWQCSAFTHENV